MNIEQGCQAVHRAASNDAWKSIGYVLSVHILLNDPARNYVGLTGFITRRSALF
jgi:hypothetical protein